MTPAGTQYALFESVEAIPVEQAPQEPAGRRFSDYVVYVDESGDHSLASIDRDYPVFVLALCVFHKRHYAEKIRTDICSLYFCCRRLLLRYSTLQDLDAGRHTEIDMFSGALMAMGKELGIPTPYNEYTYHIIKALEEKNDGLFDYSGQNKENTCAR
mgnify:CR=1 FL=1